MEPAEHKNPVEPADDTTAALKNKLRKKLRGMRSTRTGGFRTEVAANVSKKDRAKYKREVQKEGVGAVLKHFGITDPNIKRMISNAVKTGEIGNMDELKGALERMMRQEAEAAQVAPPDDLLPEVEPIPSLPSARPERSTLTKGTSRKKLRPPRLAAT